MPTRALLPVSSPCCSAASAHVAARLSSGAAALRQPPAHRQGGRSSLHRSAAVCMAAGKQVEVRGRQEQLFRQYCIVAPALPHPPGWLVH
jgi:hypothetical protein